MIKEKKEDLVFFVFVKTLDCHRQLVNSLFLLSLPWPLGIYQVHVILFGDLGCYYHFRKESKVEWEDRRF